MCSSHLIYIFITLSDFSFLQQWARRRRRQRRQRKKINKPFHNVNTAPAPNTFDDGLTRKRFNIKSVLVLLVFLFIVNLFSIFFLLLYYPIVLCFFLLYVQYLNSLFASSSVSVLLLLLSVSSIHMSRFFLRSRKTAKLPKFGTSTPDKW